MLQDCHCTAAAAGSHASVAGAVLPMPSRTALQLSSCQSHLGLVKAAFIGGPPSPTLHRRCPQGRPCTGWRRPHHNGPRCIRPRHRQEPRLLSHLPFTLTQKYRSAHKGNRCHCSAVLPQPRRRPLSFEANHSRKFSFALSAIR